MIESTRGTSLNKASGSASGGARPRIALAHDWLCGYRGGEAVLERIAALSAELGDVSGLYVMFDDGRHVSAAVDSLREAGLVRASGLNRLPMGPGTLRRWLLPAYPRAVESLSGRLARDHRRRPIDLLISTSSAAIKGLRPPPGIPHICYCHSPARYIWSQTAQYGSAGGRASPVGALRSLGLALYKNRFRAWDRRSAGNVTQFVANSSSTANLIVEAYGRKSVIIHPPVRTGYFTPDPTAAREDFWLAVSALEPYKRIDLAISAAKLAGVRLIIAGRGSQLAALKKHARSIGAHAEFRGRVEDAELRGLYRNARLLLFPQIEDFGIVAAEALACGLPVLARRAGGATDIIVEESTGAFFDAPTPAAIVSAAHKVTATPEACRGRAERFSEEAFDARMQELIASTLPQRLTPRPAPSSR